MMNINA